ncbi:MAG: chemotaxis protein CheD [Gemmatimonadales bacterium]
MRTRPAESGAGGDDLTEVVVKVADWAAERGDGVLITLGLGSCVAIMLHDRGARAGAMAHVLLPSRSLVHDATNPAKFPDTAVPLLVERLRVLGAERQRLVAKLAGGASMFSQLLAPGAMQMGERNVVAARDALRAAAIPIVGEAVGGERGRTVRFHVADGRVEIRSVGLDVTII